MDKSPYGGAGKAVQGATTQTIDKVGDAADEATLSRFRLFTFGWVGD